MKYLITGGAGFIGSALTKKLTERGDTVIVVDNLTGGKADNLKDVPGVTTYYVPMGNYEHLLSLVRSVDFVIHMAATVGVKRGMSNIVGTITNNLYNTEMIMRTCSFFNVPIFFASTSEVYGKSSGEPLQESDDLVYGQPSEPRWVYAQTKALGESIAHHYRKTKNLKFIIGRFFNVVGEGQNSEYGSVMPSFINSAVLNKDIVVHGDGSQTRAFCHIDDAVNAVISLIDSECFGEAYNIGNPQETTIEDLAWKVRALAESTSEIVHIPYEEAYGANFGAIEYRSPNTNKILIDTGWKAAIDLDEIIKEMVANAKTN